MEKINIGKAHWGAIALWIGASAYSIFGKNNFDLFFSIFLLMMACMLWYIFVADNTRRMQKSLHITGYRCLFMMLSLIIMLAMYYILLVRLELINAIITAWIGNIAMAIAAFLTYQEVKKSSN